MNELQWGKAEGGWRLSLSLDKPEYQPGEPVIVTLILQNMSQVMQRYGAQDEDFDFHFDCRDEAGKAVPLTLFGQAMKRKTGGSYTMGELDPGEDLVVEMSLSRHVDLSMGDKYTVTVSREIFPKRNAGHAKLLSNACSFEIVE